MLDIRIIEVVTQETDENNNLVDKKAYRIIEIVSPLGHWITWSGSFNTRDQAQHSIKEYYKEMITGKNMGENRSNIRIPCAY